MAIYESGYCIVSDDAATLVLCILMLKFFAKNAIISGEDEIQEAYYVFSHLGYDEQMWDCKEKEVDNFVVKKLLTR